MLADRVRMGNSKGGLILYDKGVGAGNWEIGLSSYETETRKGIAIKNLDHLHTGTYSDYPASFSATFSTVDKINLTKINTINLLCQIARYSYNTGLYVQNDKKNPATVVKAIADYEIYEPQLQVVSIDVSSIVGEYYISVGVIRGLGNNQEILRAYKIWLE